MILFPRSRASGERSFSVAMAACLVLAGLAVAEPPTTRAADPDSAQRTQPTRLLPDQLPLDVPGGTIDTPLGPARWVHLRGDQEALPSAPMIGRDGLLWFYGGRSADPSGPPDCASIEPRLWTSTDAVSTRVEHRLPVDTGYAFLTYDEGGYWLNDRGSHRGSHELWRSADLTDWDRIDVSALVPPDPRELTWNVQFGWPVTSAGVSIVPVSYAADGLGPLLGLPERDVQLEAAGGAGRYVVIETLPGSGGRTMREDIGTVRVERTAKGIRLVDKAGTTIAELTGVGPDFIEALASGGAIYPDGLALVDGSRMLSLTVPGLGSMNPSSPGIGLLPLDPGFLAFQRAADTTIRTWRSTDGRSWIEGDRVPGPDGRPMRTQSLWAGSSGGRHEVSVSPVEGAEEGGPSVAWSSVDGETWTVAPQPPAGISYPAVKLPAGYLAWTDSDIWSASVDGMAWMEAPELSEVITRTVPNGNGSMGGGAVGDALVFQVADDCGTRDLWIVEFEGEAAAPKAGVAGQPPS